MRQLFLLVSLMLFSLGSQAAENINYSCTMNGAERSISVVYLTNDQEVPCEVRYSKDGETQVLWTYANETGQCEQKAESFAEKQESWGWECATGAPETADATAE